MIIDALGAPALPPELPLPALATLAQALANAPEEFCWDRDRAGLDLRCAVPVPTGTNRARVKLFAPTPHTAVAFLYKDSQIPFSTDRFAYGALILKGRAASAEEVRGLIDYLASGLHPERRPAGLKRAFPFTVPR